MKRLLRIVAACGLTLLGIAAARAQAYPNNKPITIITAFGPGSASDTITRVLAQPLGIALKQSVIVEARPGANGAISAMYVARAAPDGYTLLMTTNSPHSAVPFLMKNVALRSDQGFHPGIAVRQLHADALRASERAGEDRQGADRLRQGQSGQADLRQRQHRGHRRRRDAQALGRSSTCCTCPTRARRRASTTCSPAGCR